MRVVMKVMVSLPSVLSCVRERVCVLGRRSRFESGRVVRSEGNGSDRGHSNLRDGCTSFEADLHQRVHLESNVLFPRAVELEASAI
jgi:hypothetical protein